jgi:hypothetical protein
MISHRAGGGYDNSHNRLLSSKPAGSHHRVGVTEINTQKLRRILVGHQGLANKIFLHISYNLLVCAGRTTTTTKAG